jgi:hypothetical protein
MERSGERSQQGPDDSLGMQLEELKLRRCFGHGPFSAYLLSPQQFAGVARAVGAVRARSYLQVSPHGPEDVDLDGRDASYWHLLVWDDERRSLAGSLRMALSRWHSDAWDGQCSYLEHCYPGLDAALAELGMAYAEIGRSFVAPAYQRSSQALLVLLQAMASIPLHTGHHHLFGMVSYNHFQHAEGLSSAFLAGLGQAPFVSSLCLPPPRYPLVPNGPAEGSAISLVQLEAQLRSRWDAAFRLPLLLRKYVLFGNARVVDFSIARDFNQITEILMHGDLTSLSKRQRRSLLRSDLVPVWADQAAMLSSDTRLP